jgi:RNA polymerase sigma factor (sigma-70 family)
VGTVTNEEFERQWKNIDNQRVLRSVLRKYKHLLPNDVLHSCGMVAVWKACGNHNWSMETKFVSSVYRYAKWQCQTEARKASKRIRTIGLKRSYEKATLDIPKCLTKHGEVQELIETLSFDWQKDIIRQYYINGKSLSAIADIYGYSKETARKKLSEAVGELRKSVFSSRNTLGE